jgi:Ca-activated chloride channel family protein
MKVEARLTFEKIRHDQDTDAHLVLALTAPPIEEQTKRPALCIIPVIDVSPSMFEYSGQKIAYAKKSVEKLIEHLGPGDYCGLVQFSGTAEVLQRPVKITAESKINLKRKVSELSSGNATNIADALLVGLDLGNKADLPGSVIVRVVLFTDGQANRGPETTSAGLVKLLEANLGSCTTSAFGYGSDADQNLLGELAKKGSGNYAFVQNPDDALTAFGKELGGLLSTYATNLLINVTAAGSHEITDVVSDVDSEEEKIGQGVRIKIPDILAEEVRHIVIGVKLKAQTAEAQKAVHRPVSVFEVKAGWDILDANSKKERRGADAKAKVQFVKEGEEQKDPDVELDKIVGLAQVVRAQLEAEESAKKGDYRGAQKRMKLAADSLGSRGHDQAVHLARQISERLGSAPAYAQNGGYLRSVATGGTRGYGGASYDVQAAADLSGMGVSLSNSLQSSTSSTFASQFQAVDIGDAGGDSGHTFTGTVGVWNPGTGFEVPIPMGSIASGSTDPGSVIPNINVPSVFPPLPPTDSDNGEHKAPKKKLSKKAKGW